MLAVENPLYSESTTRSEGVEKSISDIARTKNVAVGEIDKNTFAPHGPARFCNASCVSVRDEKFRQLVGISLVLRELEGILIGYPAWIRTKNNASKGRCVTVTPRGTRICDFRLLIFDSSAMSKIKCDCASAKQLAEKIRVE